MDTNLEGIKQSKIFFAGKVNAKQAEKAHEERRERSKQTSNQITKLIADDEVLTERLTKVLACSAPALRVQVPTTAH